MRIFILVALLAVVAMASARSHIQNKRPPFELPPPGALDNLGPTGAILLARPPKGGHGAPPQGGPGAPPQGGPGAPPQGGNSSSSEESSSESSEESSSDASA